MSSGFLMLLDDIAATADDISAMSKVAVKKTAGILGDDLALNAEQVSGVSSNRELPVVYKVFKGSLLNKLVLVPLALLISYFVPYLMIPLLMIGGAFLCYEGVESLYEKFVLKTKKELNEEVSSDELIEYETKKVKGAIRTDFILSAEIVVISLTSLGETTITNKIIALSLLAVGFTFFVYGLVALIVRLDDIGFWFKKHKSRISKSIGDAFISIVPYIMKSLSVVGLIAMFLVGGGIILHGLVPLYEIAKEFTPDQFFLNFIVSSFYNFGVAFIVGSFIVSLHVLYIKFKK